jgi:hypothetical protein
MLVAQASGAKIDLLGFTVDIDGGRVYIRRPTTVGMTLRMADIMTELRCLTAQIAFQFSLAP